MAEATRQVPSVERTPWWRPLEPAARFSFRGDADARSAAAAAFGVALPERACQAASAARRAALWLGPDEQLLLAPAAEGAAVRAALATALGDRPHSVVDISHRQTALEIAGPRAAWLLNSGCPLDLDAAAFAPGMCTRTVFHKAEIVLWRTGADAFRVEVWRSFADYLVGLLGEAARELSG